MVTAGFDNWEQIADCIPSIDKLFCSGSPHYSGINNHNFDKKAINFFKTLGIKHIISLNSKAITNTKIKEKLVPAGIVYILLLVANFNALTKKQLLIGNEVYKKYQDGTLIGCSYRHRRTSTMITTLQIYILKNITSPKILRYEHY